MADRPKVGMADPATIRRKLAEQHAQAVAEANAGMYQNRPHGTTRVAEPAANVGTQAVDAMRGLDALTNRKKYLAKALKDAGA